MFRTVSLSVIKSLVLYTQHNLLLCVKCQTPDDGQRIGIYHIGYAACLLAGSGCSILIPLGSSQHNILLCVMCQTPDDGQRNCPKHIEFYSNNKFEKLVQLLGFIIRMSEFVQRDSEKPRRLPSDACDPRANNLKSRPSEYKCATHLFCNACFEFSLLSRESITFDGPRGSISWNFSFLDMNDGILDQTIHMHNGRRKQVEYPKFLKSEPKR